MSWKVSIRLEKDWYEFQLFSQGKVYQKRSVYCSTNQRLLTSRMDEVLSKWDCPHCENQHLGSIHFCHQCKKHRVELYLKRLTDIPGVGSVGHYGLAVFCIGRGEARQAVVHIVRGTREVLFVVAACRKSLSPQLKMSEDIIKVFSEALKAEKMTPEAQEKLKQQVLEAGKQAFLKAEEEEKKVAAASDPKQHKSVE